MQLEWHRLARADRGRIFDCIVTENPRAALGIDERFDAAVARLRDYPESGRPGRVEGTRELVVSGTPYVIPYRIDGNRVRLLRILHGAQQWPDQFSS